MRSYGETRGKKMEFKPDEKLGITGKILRNHWILGSLRFITNVGAVLSGIAAALFLSASISAYFSFLRIGYSQDKLEMTKNFNNFCISALISAIFVISYLYLTNERWRTAKFAPSGNGQDPSVKPTFRFKIIKFISNIGAVVFGAITTLFLIIFISEFPDFSPGIYHYVGGFYVGGLGGIFFLLCITAFITIIFIALYFRTPGKKSTVKNEQAKPVARTTRFCTHCGTAVDGSSQFCIICGNSLKEDSGHDITIKPDIGYYHPDEEYPKKDM